ncbi:hypothetical protein CIRMBP1271_02095 [Enterococcus cecorum]|uniref:DUF7768 domain-containing protein n=1 Tax=Enterococcus cecorum TaxID=44008 RepID=UPI0022D36F64|nr:DUF4406 domain-containing protein [Enterococcus cecorum]CAI3254757.1 hypothetical protein CIRMBP1267_00053 [Enterococcus cecorum]CAI3385866.1 hypothetical protein CIRMBP1274_01407 [Enterococcus cecorum]CAI3442019.1 hypothetical protein CIRMBP1240_02077 [Enterococcus cecorum]CAI3442562.1 hypothetical protein CIRMBP1265_01997 [Enterococcus cecorum]CAI3449371.1 hypothetical protein CIRMBP1276_02019 [Enterococcus cecorum]
MLIYVCSPYSGQVELNVAKASNYSKYVVDAGHTPIAPHLLFPQFLNDDIPEERNRAIQMNMEILKKCDQLWVFGKIFSEGMKEEINFASQYMIPIQYIVFHDENPQIFNHFADQIDDAGWAIQQSEKFNLAHSRKISIAQEVANDFSCRFDEVENVFFINATRQIQSKVQILRDAVSEFVIRCKREEEYTP